MNQLIHILQRFKSPLYYLIFQFLSKGIVFLSTPLLISTISKSEYGLYSLFISLIPTVSIFFDLAQRSSLKKLYFEYSLKKVYSNLILIYVQILILLIISSLILHYFNYIYIGRRFTFFLLGVAALFSLSEVYLALLQINKSFVRYNVLFFLRNTTPYFIAIPIILFFQKDIEWFFGSQLIVFFIICLYSFFTIIRNFDKKLVDFNFLKNSLSFGIPLIPSILSSVLLNLSDRYIIEIYHGAERVAEYTIQYLIASIFLIIIMAINKSWQPYILSNLYRNNIKNVKYYSRRYILIAILIAISIWVFKNQLIVLLSNESYVQFSHIVPIILLGMFFYFLFTIHYNVVFYYKDRKYIILPAIVASIVNIILNFILIPRYGFEIAAYTTLIAYFIEFIIVFVIVRVKYKISIV